MFSLGAHRKKTQVIIDTDAGFDDLLAIGFLILNGQVEIKAITIMDTGLAHAEAGAKNVLKLLHFLGRKDIPIAYNLKRIYEGEHSMPDKLRDLSDNLLDSLPPVHDNPNPNAVDLLKQTIKKSINIDIICLGPLTNLALLIENEANIVNNINRMWIMGGAIHCRGNVADLFELPDTSEEYMAECNIWLDINAAQTVFKSIQRIFLLPLDVSNMLPVTISDLELFNSLRPNPFAEILSLLLEPNRHLIETGIIYYWDLTLAVIISSKEPITESEHLHICITDNGVTKLVETPTSSTLTSVMLSADATQLMGKIKSLANKVQTCPDANRRLMLK